MYTVDYFIKKFEQIEECLWCSGTFMQPLKFITQEEIKFFGIIFRDKVEIFQYNQFCAQGHCLTLTQANYVMSVVGKKFKKNEVAKSYPEWNALIMLFKENDLEDVGKINNGDSVHYQQESPKLRILQALYDIKRKQELIKPSIVSKEVSSNLSLCVN